MEERPILFNGEAWKPCFGYETRYEVSDFGRVRSVGSFRKSDFQKILKTWVQNKGYHYVTLRSGDSRKAHAVHKLVLETFGFIKPPGMQCAHFDGDPSNNKLENLRWTTSQENINDRKRHGRTACGEKQGSAKLDRKLVRTIKRLKGVVSANEVAHLACISQSTISSIWNGETWKHVSEE